MEIKVMLWLTNRAILFSIENESRSLGLIKSLVDRRYSYGASNLLLQVSAVIGPSKFCRIAGQEKKIRGIERQKPSKEGPAARNV
jgi:hypothetical protein